MDIRLDDRKKVHHVFETTKLKKARKKLTEHDLSEDSISEFYDAALRTSSPKQSLPSIIHAVDEDRPLGKRGSCPSVCSDTRRRRSPKRHRRSQKDGMSLALKSEMVSPRSDSPNGAGANLRRDQIYKVFEEEVKKDKKKKRQSRRHEERQEKSDREASHHRTKTDSKEKSNKESDTLKSIDANAFFETFAKMCAQVTEKTTPVKELSKTQSNKSLKYEVNATPMKKYNSKDLTAKRRSTEYIPQNVQNYEECNKFREQYIMDKQSFVYPEEHNHFLNNDFDRYKANSGHYNEHVNVAPTRSRIASRKERDIDRRNEYDKKRQQYDKQCFDNRDLYDYKDLIHIDRRNRESDKRYDEARRTESYVKDDFNKLRPERSKFDRHCDYGREQYLRRINYDTRSMASRDERALDSGLSIADGNSVISAKSNYFRSMKQELSEQREAMDSMMQLWKELMRCVKGMSQADKKDDKEVQETAMNARHSAVEHIRLWQECMRRYETVARDVGDTDARLMEEINKQRSEMCEMSTMWQECLQRYRDISKDFNNLKQQLAINEVPSRIPPPSPLLNAEGEGLAATPYRMPSSYGNPPIQPMPQYPGMPPPVRTRASVPPSWWWYNQDQMQRMMSPARRRSSPDSRGSRERRKHRDRDDSRYKEKSKPTAARSEHRHKKR